MSTNKVKIVKISEKIQSSKLGRLAYNRDPDYEKPLFKLPEAVGDRLFSRLRFLYGEVPAREYLPELERIIKVHAAHKPAEMIEAEQGFDPDERFTEKDMVLITYGDILDNHDRGTPLSTLHQLVNTYNLGAINTLHLLPFFPYSSDRGFAVIDYRRVDPRLGSWEDIRAMAGDYDLMFDGVMNHCSSQSQMFKEYLNGNPRFQDFFISYASPDDLTPDQRSKIFRPRTSDILTRYHTITGPRYVWTTFSDDQIDLNFRNPAVLTQVIDGLLFYVRHGADILRLDAVTYIWAEPGTECVHLPQTHEIVKLIRDVLDAVSPGVALLTETNVPHQENISYFGNGRDEAHMVYNFALPPLVLHTFYSQDSSALSRWAQSMANPSRTATFFNILDTHDGIGLMGAGNILTKTEINALIERAIEHGAYISYKTNEEHVNEPYEINSTWWSAINGDSRNEDVALQVKRHLASRSIALVLQGVPGLYIHGLTGTSNDHELVAKSAHNRDVNRGIIDPAQIAEQLDDPRLRLSLLRRGNSRMNLVRTSERAFHPHGKQRVFMTDPKVFTILRSSPEEDQHILAVTNVSDQRQKVEIKVDDLGFTVGKWHELLSGQHLQAGNGRLRIELQPYDVLWLKRV